MTMINWNDYQFTDKTILIIEDVESSIKFFEAALSKINSNLLWAIGGDDAIRVFDDNRNTIDIVLLDLNLPVVNGFKVLEHIKKVSPNIPVVVQTAYLFSGEEEKSISMGANAFIAKPVHLELLLNTFSKYLKSTPTV